MKWFDKIETKTLLRLAILLFCMLFIPYIILCFYAHPSADDYTYTPVYSFWGTQLDAYLHWNGRYSANFMVMSDPILYGSLAMYRLAALSLVLLIPISVYFLVSSLVGKLFTPLQKILITGICCLLILGLLPSLPEGIYWYPGAMTYILGGVIAMFYMGCIIRYFNSNYIVGRAVHFCLCILLLCISIGFNEVQMFLLLAGHIVVWASQKREDRFRSDWLVLLLFTVAFSSVMLFAPGNHYRGVNFPTNHNLVNSLFMTLLQMPRFFFTWVSYAPLIIGSILFAPISFKLNEGSTFYKKLGNYNPWILFASLWAILFFCIFPPYWSTAILGQHRTLNTACFFFIPAWFLFLHTVYSRNNIGEQIARILSRPLQIGLILLLMGSLLFSGNCGTALMEFETGKISAFNKELDHRNDIVMTAQKEGLKRVAVPLLKDKPSSLFVLDIEPGYFYWFNHQYARFYGLERIYADSTKDSNFR